MKKFLSLCLAALVVFSAVGTVVGCGSSSDSGEKAAPVDKDKDAQTQKGGQAPAQTND